MKSCVDNQDAAACLTLFQRFETLHNATMYMLAIKACTNCDDADQGRRIISDIDFSAMSARNAVDLKNTMIHFYGNAKDSAAAKATFDSNEDKFKDVVSINAMMDALCISDMNKECLELFEAIPSINPLIVADMVTYKIAVTATTFAASSMERVAQLYSEIKYKQQGMLEDVEMQNKLINMLSKYGMVAECEEIFESVATTLDICNAMIRAHCDNGDLSAGFRL